MLPHKLSKRHFRERTNSYFRIIRTTLYGGPWSEGLLPHHPNDKNHQGTKRDDRGVVGRVARFMGQQRVAIYLEGLLTITTAYVPNDFLEPFDDPAAETPLLACSSNR